MKNPEDNFQVPLRNLSVKTNSPISHRGGRWTVNNRLEVWEAVGARFFDDDLDRFAETAIKVLSERDPQFDLKRDERFASAIYGKVLKHTPDLRHGIAETLALLGTKSQYLISCKQGKPQYTANYVVESLLSKTDWQVWAGLNDVLPLLAEAAPETFLSSLENTLKNNSELFTHIFNEEGSGIGGRNYMTGLLWALETLAWSSDYFIQVIMILAEMATFDPGGRWANRPSNSLWTILLPWYPQTLASIPQRIAGVNTVCNEFPEVGWELLLALLPQSHQSSTNNRRPVWRDLIPVDWKEGEPNNENYWNQINAYGELALTKSMDDPSKLRILIDYLQQLPPASREKLITYLGTIDRARFTDEELLSIWNRLIDFITKHRKYAGAKWAWPSEEIDRVAKVAERLFPESPSLRYRRLFVRNEFDLNEETVDFEKGRVDLERKRINAIKEIYDEGGLDKVLAFSRSVEAPDQVGGTFASFASLEDELTMLSSLLTSELAMDINFSGAYVWRKFREAGWDWFGSVNQEAWSPFQKARFLSFLPFNSETWEVLEKALPTNSQLYWEMTWGNSYDINDGNYKTAVENLLKVGRAAKAADVLTTLWYRQITIEPEFIVLVLESLKPDDIKLLSSHSIIQLIQALQTAEERDELKLREIEWIYLGLLDGYQASPVTLEKYLAEDSSFFCEIIGAIYRSRKVKSETIESGVTIEEEQDGNQHVIAMNAYKLLNNWRSLPGIGADNKLDGKKLQDWTYSAVEKCAETGRVEVAMQHIGHVLYHSPSDPDGLWLHRSVAEILNNKEADHIRKGYEIEAFNSRGVFTVDPEGNAEKDIAESYRKKANEIELAGYHRIAVTLRNIAAEYDSQAKRFVVEADEGTAN